jgi:probable HAF family extracellular repeat protein
VFYAKFRHIAAAGALAPIAMRAIRLTSLAAIAGLIVTAATPATAAPARAGLRTVDMGDWGRGGYVQDVNDRGDAAGGLNDENATAQPVLWPVHGGPVRIGVGPGLAAAVNNHGDAVGDNWLWTNGQVRMLTHPYGGVQSVDINDRRQVVGNLGIAPDEYGHVFLWQNGQFTLITAPDGMHAFANSVNNRGEVLGYVVNADWSVRQGFVWRAGVMSLLAPLGGTMVDVRAINDRGQVVGFSSLAGSDVVHPFLWQNGRMTDLMAGRPTERGYAMDVNNAGDVVGNVGSRAVLWRAGRTVDLALPGQYGYARLLNERGDIAGTISSQTSTGDAQNQVFRWRHGRILLSEAFGGETSLVVAGLDSHGRVAGMIDDMASPVRPVRWLAEGA